MIVICGLGNPGTKYKGTRHNLGFAFIDAILKKYKFTIFKKDKSREIYKGQINKKKYYLVKPLTFVNLSGYPIAKFLNYYKIPKKNLIVVHDDLDLAVKKIKIKLGGGNGGHNGLLSIDENIGNAYYRYRLGIGRPVSKELVSQYVLEKFSKEEKMIIKKVIDFSAENIDLLFKDKQLFLTKVNSLLHKTI